MTVAGPTRETVISYGTWNSNDTYWHLNGADSITLDERTFTCTFDVVCVTPTAALNDTARDTAEAQWNQRHQDFKIVVDSVTLFHFVDGVDSVGAGEEAAEFIKVTWRDLGTHRSKKSRAYRISVEVTRSADQAGKTGVLDQGIRVTTNPLGKRRLAFRAQFTPGPGANGTGTAMARYNDATYGFEKLVSDLQTVLTGTWERSGSIGQAYDEDSRTLVASATYEELIYNQSQGTRNDSALVGAKYDIRVERKSSLTIPGQLATRPFTIVTVLFSSGVLISESQDLTSMVTTKVLPYVRDTVSKAFGLTSATSTILLGHGLRADPIENRIAGQVFFLVSEGNVLEISKRVSDIGRTGETFIPVLTGGKWDRDRHTGPGMWIRRVVIACRVVGLDAESTLGRIETNERIAHEASGFHFVGWAVNSSPSVEHFKETGGGSVTTTVQTRVLEFIRADVRTGANGGWGHGYQGGVPPVGSVADTDDQSFRERA